MSVSSKSKGSATGVSRSVPNDLKAHLLAGFAVVAILVGGVGVWASTTQLAGAVIGMGTVVVDSNVKKVQHPTGGIVGEIKIREGSRVQEGDLLIRLDETITRANLGIVLSQLDELAARQARLVAERDELPNVTVPDELGARASLPEVAAMITAETNLFESRRRSRSGQKAQLEERLKQLEQEIQGIEVQTLAKGKELEFIRVELQEIEKLWAKNLAPLSKRIQLNREATRIDGERGQLIASLAQARAKVAETRLQIMQIDSDMRTEVTKDLREVKARQAELSERRVAAEDQLKRVELRAPQSGMVHQLNAFTVGGVINAGEPVMLIVPQDEKLVLDVRIGPQDVSQVRAGQEAWVRLTSFNQRTTPEIKGMVTRVSADLLKEQQSNQIYYMVRLALPEAEVAKLGDQKLVPGMPAEVYIQTEQRTAISYLLKPLSDQIARAFKER